MLERLQELIKKNRKNKKWSKIFRYTAGLVLFLTVYALIIPALTLGEEDASNLDIVPDLLKGRGGSEALKSLSEERTISSLKIITMPEKTSYKEGEAFQGRGMELLISYDDGQQEEVGFDLFEDYDLETRPVDGQAIDFKEGREYIQVYLKNDKTISHRSDGFISLETELLVEDLEGEGQARETGEEVASDPGKARTFQGEEEALVAKVELAKASLPEDAVLKVEAIKEDEDLEKFDEDTGKTLEEKTKEIQSLVEGEVKEIFFYDLSFYEEDDTYIPVSDDAKVLLSTIGGEISLGPEEEITVFHFEKEGAKELETRVKVDEQDKVEEVAFDTEGFSVFAVVKHSSWVELNFYNSQKSIVSKNQDGTYSNLQIVGSSISSSEIDISNVGNEFPKRMDSPNNHTGFIVQRMADNTYVFKEIGTSEYLGISAGELTLSTSEFKFKIYGNSAYPGQVLIRSAERINDKYWTINYDGQGSYSLSDTPDEMSYHYLSINRKMKSYKILSLEEIRSLRQGVEYDFIITSLRHGNNNNNNDNLRSLNSDSAGGGNLDSSSLYRDGNYLYINDRDPEKNNERTKDPTVWTFKKEPNGVFTIRDKEKNGNYLSIGASAGGFRRELKLISPTEADNNPAKDFAIVEIYRDNYQVRLRNTDQGVNFNLADGGSTWQGYWSLGTDNDNLVLATPSTIETSISYQEESGLVEAIIPDGDYSIKNIDSSQALYTRSSADGYLRSSTGSPLFRIERQGDGTYRIFSGYNKLRIGDGPRSTNPAYGNAVLTLDDRALNTVPLDGQEIRILTLETDPSAFYIVSKYGSLQYVSTRRLIGTDNRWKSLINEIGTPLRLHTRDGTRYTHLQDPSTQEQSTRKPADIADGTYVIGTTHSPLKKEGKEVIQTFSATISAAGTGGLNIVTGNIPATIHYNYQAENDNDQHHTIEGDGKNQLMEFEFKQTDRLGYYTIVAERNGTSYYIGLNQASGSFYVSDKVSDNGGSEFQIYKAEDRTDQVIIIQGEKRLRFDGNTWTSVDNSSPLKDGDYHYIGKAIDKSLYFKLTEAKGQGPDWPESVGIMEVMFASDLGGTFANSKPRGYSTGLGPIGQTWAKKNPGNLANPYQNLYRLEAGDSYKEYDFMGWEIEIEGENYFIDREASFSEGDKVTDGTSKPGIFVESSKVFKDGVQVSEDLFIPFGNKDAPLKTKWLELSAPLNFYFNSGSGIMDLERSMSVKDLLAREDSNTITPVLAKGRIFYPNMDERTANTQENTSSITANAGLVSKFRSKESLILAGGNVESLDERAKASIYNQILIDEIDGKPMGDLVGTYAKVKEDSINWLAKADTRKDLSILKKSIDGGDDTSYTVGKENIKIENYDIDFLWIKEESEAYYLQGIVYGKMIDFTIEKDFINLSPAQVEEIRQVHSTGIQGKDPERYVIKLKTRSDSGQYDSDFYSLAFNRSDDESIPQSTYPQVGDSPKEYGDIQRVSTYFDRENLRVQWQARFFKDELFVLEERGMGLESPQRNLYSRINVYRRQEVANDPYPQIDAYSHGTPKMESIETNSPIESGEAEKISFSNLYSTGGIVQVNKTDENGTPLRGISFKLEKDDGSGNFVQEGDLKTTNQMGQAIFAGLEAGSRYRLVEESTNSIYMGSDPFEFTIKETPSDKPPYYDIDNYTNTDNIRARTGTSTGGDRPINYIDITNRRKPDLKLYRLEKRFDNITYAEFEDLTRWSGDKNFTIKLTGFKSGQGEVVERLTYENADIVGKDKTLVWKLTKLGGQDLSYYDRIEVEEFLKDLDNYPVVKRRAVLNGVERDFTEYPFDIKKEEIDSPESNNLVITNIFTDTFDLVVGVRGRDERHENLISIGPMYFNLYGDFDEGGDPNDTETLDSGKTVYRLSKKHSNYSGTSPLGYNFKTNENGIEAIFDLAFLEGNQYLLANKNYGITHPVVPENYPHINPFLIEVKEDKEGRLAPHIYTKIGTDRIFVEDGAWVETPKGAFRTQYQNGIIILDFILDRTNYRLPNTGGAGHEKLYKLAGGLVLASGALLIYRKRKLGERT